MSEIKGPVMDRLKDTHFLKALTGKVFLTQFAAITSIREEISKEAVLN
jgi:SulP family sulfate permease